MLKKLRNFFKKDRHSNLSLYSGSDDDVLEDFDNIEEVKKEEEEIEEGEKKSFLEKIQDKLAALKESGGEKKDGLGQIEISFGGVSLVQKAFFAKNLAVMLRSGLTITDSLEISMDSSTGKLKKILKKISKSVNSGSSLSESLKDYPKVFPPFFSSAVYAGEESGTLEENLEQVAVQLTKEKELASKVKGAMIYPVIILIAAFVLGMFVSFTILPKITPLFESLSGELPFTTRVLIAISDTVNQYGETLLIGLISFAVFMGWLVRQKFSKPALHWLFLHAPIIKKISRGANLARFSRILGTLLKSGLNIDEALEITKNSVGNFYYKKSLTTVMQRISKGAVMSESLSEYENLYPRISARMVKVGEESGKLDESLIYLASFYEEEVDNATKNLAIAIEPILLLSIGAAVGFLALAIITPIYSITGSVERG